MGRIDTHDEMPTLRVLWVAPADTQPLALPGHALGPFEIEAHADRVAAAQRLREQRFDAVVLALGEAEDASTFNNAFVLAEKRDELTNGARERIAAWKGPGTLVVVTHGAKILPLTGVHPAQAEIVVVEPVADGKLRVVGRIPPR